MRWYSASNIPWWTLLPGLRTSLSQHTSFAALEWSLRKRQKWCIICKWSASPSLLLTRESNHHRATHAPSTHRAPPSYPEGWWIWSIMDRRYARRHVCNSSCKQCSEAGERGVQQPNLPGWCPAGTAVYKQAIETPFSTKLEKSKAAFYHATHTTISLIPLYYHAVTHNSQTCLCIITCTEDMCKVNYQKHKKHTAGTSSSSMTSSTTFLLSLSIFTASRERQWGQVSNGYLLGTLHLVRTL